MIIATVLSFVLGLIFWSAQDTIYTLPYRNASERVENIYANRLVRGLAVKTFVVSGVLAFLTIVNQIVKG